MAAGIAAVKEDATELEVAAVPGKDLTLVLRHITDEQEIVPPDVFVDGVPAGQIPIAGADAAAQETAFTVSGDLINSDRVEVEVRWNIFITEFRWWFVAGP